MQRFILLLTSLFSLAVYAVKPAAQFRLPTSDAVQCMTFDTKGYLWIGTSSGLYSYDGYQYRNYRNSLHTPDRLANNNVQSLTTDHDGHLWIGTYDGVTRMSLISGERRHYRLPHANHKIVYTLFTSRRGSVYAGTDGGLLRYDRKADCFRNIVSGKSAITTKEGIRRRSGQMNIKAIAEDKAGNLYLGTWDKGLFRLTPSTGRIEQYAISDTNIYSLCFDDCGRLWAGSWYTGLSLLTNIGHPRAVSQRRLEGYGAQRVYNILFDRTTHTIWAVTPNSTFRLFAGQMPTGDILEGVNIITGKTDSPYIRVAGNQLGTVALATLNRGVQLFSTTPSPLTMSPLLPASGSQRVGIVRTMCSIDDETILIGSLTSGLWVYNPLTLTLRPWTEAPRLASLSPVFLQSSLTSIIKDRTGNIWMSSAYHGVVRYSRDGQLSTYNRTTCPAMDDDGVISMLSMRDGTIVFGQWSDIIVLPPGQKPYRISMAEHIKGFYKGRVESLFEDCRGRLWACTCDYGVVCIEGDMSRRDGLRVSVFNRSNGRFMASGGTAMTESQKHKLHILTTEGELLEWDEKAHRFVDDGLNAQIHENRIYAMSTAVDGSLWLAAGNYLMRIIEQNGAKPVVMRYYLPGADEDILIEQNATMRVGSTLFFGGLNHIVSVDTRRLTKPDAAVPTVSITDIRADGVAYSQLDSTLRNRISREQPAYTRRITIPRSVHRLDIDVSDLTFTSKNHVLYSYTLKGFHKRWYYCAHGDNSIRLYNLPSGTYTLLVRSTDSNGQWVDMPHSVTVRVLPPWWATWWAWMIYIAVAALAVYTTIQWYRRRVRTHNQLQIARVFTNITHELLTPIAVISASIEDMRETLPEKKYKVMLNNTDRLTRLIRQILEVQKAHSGRLRLEVEEGELTEFLRTLFDNMRPLAQQKGISMEMAVEGTPRAKTYYDCDKMDKIVYNLLSNAIKYTRDGGSVRLGVAYQPAGQVAISVSDNGIGIMPQQMKNLYSRFMDGDYRKMKTMGTGIGLSLTYDLVRLHHGSINCDSTPGRGTTFTVTLPIGRSAYTKGERGMATTGHLGSELQSPDLQSSATGQPLPAGAEATDNGAEHENTVLIVEDNADLLEIMTRALAPYYNVLTAKNGRQALSVIQRNALDIVVSDVMMPVMDGMEFVRRLKAEPDYALLPVLLLTARRHDADRNAAYVAGVDAYLTKPFSMSSLLARIDNILRTREKLRERFMSQTEFTPSAQHYSDPDTVFMERAVKIVREHINDESYTRDDFAKDLCMSSSALYKKLRGLTGQNVTAFVTSIRMKEACRIMRQNPQIAIADLYCKVGYNSAAYFTKTFKKEFGMTPTEFMASLGEKD